MKTSTGSTNDSDFTNIRLSTVLSLTTDGIFSIGDLWVGLFVGIDLLSRLIVIRRPVGGDGSF
jgi:hypothetical protein